MDPKSFDRDTTICVASGNAHKIKEIEAILSKVMPDMHFVSIKELGDFEDPEENGTTFDENALIKARAALDETGVKYAIADDSGLVVDALDGAPGIMSARWAGCHGDDCANNKKLLSELEGVAEADRSAHFHSSVILLDDQGNELIGHGDCYGMIGFEPKGTNGFGYDPLFWPEKTPGQTMAELSADQKNTISHRFYALQDLARQISEK